MPESFERSALTETVFYILLSVHTPMHGYAIMQKIQQLTHNRVRLGAGTLYGALNTLSEKKWITIHTESSDGRKKEYVITSLGRKVFSMELERLAELLHNATTLKENQYGQNYQEDIC